MPLAPKREPFERKIIIMEKKNQWFFPLIPLSGDILKKPHKTGKVGKDILLRCSGISWAHNGAKCTRILYALTSRVYDAGLKVLKMFHFRSDTGQQLHRFFEPQRKE